MHAIGAQVLAGLGLPGEEGMGGASGLASTIGSSTLSGGYSSGASGTLVSDGESSKAA